MKKYIKKIPEFTVEQFTDPENPPRGVFEDPREKNIWYIGHQLALTRVYLSDYIITDELQNITACREEYFEQSFTPVDPQ